MMSLICFGSEESYAPSYAFHISPQINVATASLATAGEGLLRQIREVKLAVMLQVSNIAWPLKRFLRRSAAVRRYLI